MKIAKVCCVILLGLYLLSGCGTSSTQSGRSEQSVPLQNQAKPPDDTPSSVATFIGITKNALPERPGVTRVNIILDKKTSYSTSREGNQLIINVFSAQMTSPPFKQLGVRDPVVKSIVSTQVGTSVKSIIELVNPDVAYTPSTLTNPYRILVDIWQISPNTMQTEADAPPSPLVVSEIEKPASFPSETKEVVVDAQGIPESPAVQEPRTEKPLLVEQMPSQDIPIQLQWFSEKLSQVLQEREEIKQELLDIEKNIAVKDSMIEVLERKVREANNRIVELEEDLITAKSKASLMEQGEQTMQQELQQVLVQLESISGGREAPALDTSSTDKGLTNQSRQILAKISNLQQGQEVLSKANDQLGSLKSQVDMLLNELEELHQKNETHEAKLESQKQVHIAEVKFLKDEISRLGSVELALQAKEQELFKLQKVIGDAAKLISTSPEQSVALSPPTPTPIPTPTPFPTPTPLIILPPTPTPIPIIPQTTPSPEPPSAMTQRVQSSESEHQIVTQFPETSPDTPLIIEEDVVPETSPDTPLIIEEDVVPETSPDTQLILAEDAVPKTSPDTQFVFENPIPEISPDTQLILEDLAQPPQAMKQEQTASLEDYVLGPNDVIQIKVVDNEGLGKTVTVSPDGFITYPFLGDLRVDGLSTAQLDAQMTSLLARDFLIDPEVVIEVVTPRSKKVYIMGAVKQPGYHELQEDERLLNTLLNAGGPTSFNAEVRILRLPKQELDGEAAIDSLVPIITDLNALFAAGDQNQNILLQDGDVVMVTSKLEKPTEMVSGSGESFALEGTQRFFVVGSVAKPGIYTYQKDDTVLDAILRAGGFTEFALRNGTKVIRESENKTKTFRIKMKDVMENGDMEGNIPIMPGDMIIVPENFL